MRNKTPTIQTDSWKRPDGETEVKPSGIASQDPWGSEKMIVQLLNRCRMRI